MNECREGLHDEWTLDICCLSLKYTMNKNLRFVKMKMKEINSAWAWTLTGSPVY